MQKNITRPSHQLKREHKHYGKKTNRCYRINIRALFGSVGTTKFTPLIIINDEHRSLGKKRTSKTNETIKKVGIGLIEKIS